MYETDALLWQAPTIDTVSVSIGGTSLAIPRRPPDAGLCPGLILDQGGPLCRVTVPRIRERLMASECPWT